LNREGFFLTSFSVLKTNEGCIGSKTLTELYGLSLVKENIEDSKENTTRFVILSNKQQDKSKNSKGIF